MTDIASNNKRALTDVDGNAPSVTKKAKGGKNKKVTQKELNEKIKWATKSELTLLLKDINEKFPAVQEAYRPFVPSNSPFEVLQDDPLLKECFNCRETENLIDFHGCMLCSNCHKSSYSREEVMDMFGFSKTEAMKLKHGTGNGMFGGIKYVFDPDTVVKAVEKRDGSLFDFVVRKAGGRSRPNIGDLMEKATTAAKKKKVVNDAIKHSSEPELKILLQLAMTQVPELMDKDGLIDTFVPTKLPCKPTKDDPILQMCFHCRRGNDNLLDFYDVKVCEGCDPRCGKHAGTLTRERVQNYFHFSKSEADKIPRKKTTGGFYKSLIYVYNLKTVVTAAKKKHGSLYNMVKNH